MDTVTVSPKFQVVIPEAVRKAAGIVPGEKFSVVYRDHILKYVPVQDVSVFRGKLKGLKYERQKKDRFD